MQSAKMPPNRMNGDIMSERESRIIQGLRTKEKIIMATNFFLHRLKRNRHKKKINEILKTKLMTYNETSEILGLKPSASNTLL